jgi:type II secretory pathway component PulF
MKIINKLTEVLTFKKKKKFVDLNDWALAGVGAFSFLFTSYWGIMISDVIPEFLKTVNEVGISLPAINLALWFSGFGFYMWFFGCIALRCHTLLYERWFK